MKRIIPALICAAIVFALPQTVRAHPGKTDSAGGHTDRSTGEYHYHHGYEAHDHYDMDGDGIVDCPYDFDDQTDHDSGSSDDSSNNYIYDPPSTRATDPPIVITTTPAEEAKTTEEVKTVPNWVYWVFGIMLIAIIVAVKEYFSLYSEKNKIEQDNIDVHRLCNETAKLNQKITNELQETKEKASSLKDRLTDAYKNIAELTIERDKLEDKLDRLEKERTILNQDPHSKKTISVTAKKPLPSVISTTSDNKPALGEKEENKPFGELTVYISSKGKIFHTDRECSNTTLKAVDYWDIVSSYRYRPCLKCVSQKQLKRLDNYVKLYASCTESRPPIRFRI